MSSGRKRSHQDFREEEKDGDEYNEEEEDDEEEEEEDDELEDPQQQQHEPPQQHLPPLQRQRHEPPQQHPPPLQRQRHEPPQQHLPPQRQGVGVNFGMPGVGVNFGMPGVRVNFGMPGVDVNFGMPAQHNNNNQQYQEYEALVNRERRHRFVPVQGLAVLNEQRFIRNNQITLGNLDPETGSTAHRKGFIYLQLLRTIANVRKHNQVKFYKSRDPKKNIMTKGYDRLFLCRVIREDKPVDQLVYVMVDSTTNERLWEKHGDIRDNGGITIGTIFCMFKPSPYESIMPDGIPSIESRHAACVMKHPEVFVEVPIDTSCIEGGQSKCFCLNNCRITILESTVEDAGCSGGQFCDQQRVLEVIEAKSGCCCYNSDSRKTNIIMVHKIEIEHVTIPNGSTLIIDNFSSVQFSLYFQNRVFSSNVQRRALDETEIYYTLEGKQKEIVDCVEDWTVIGWCKRGQITDRTILQQNTNNDVARQSHNDTSSMKIDSSTISYHACVIKPTHPKFTTPGTAYYEAFQNMKFDTASLSHNI